MAISIRAFIICGCAWLFGAILIAGKATAADAKPQAAAPTVKVAAIQFVSQFGKVGELPESPPCGQRREGTESR